MSVVRAAITQTDWTGDKESMIARHEQFARDAADQGAGIICFQELFYGPYFGIIEDTKYYAYAESIPGPTVERFQKLAQALKLVIVLPIYEEEMPGLLYNTAAVIDADGRLLGKYRLDDVDRVAGDVARAAELVAHCRDRITAARTQVQDVVADLSPPT